MRVLHLGRVAYQPAWEIQKEVLAEVLNGSPDTLIFVEHDPVLTLGSNFHESNLLFSPAEYEARGIEVVRTDRGGDVTYHGPGQLVIYPIFNLENHGRDLHRWLRELEEAIIKSLIPFNVSGKRFPPHTGVWVESSKMRKIAAIGVKVKRWVSMHGIALNVDTNISAFDLIVPCGIVGHGVTSLHAESNQKPTLEEVATAVESGINEVFVQKTST